MSDARRAAGDPHLARIRAVFEAALTPQQTQFRHDPNREVPLREGYERMHLNRLVFKKKFRDQRTKIERNQVIDGALLPEPHPNEHGQQCFWQWQVDAYINATKSAGGL